MSGSLTRSGLLAAALPAALLLVACSDTGGSGSETPPAYDCCLMEQEHQLVLEGTCAPEDLQARSECGVTAEPHEAAACEPWSWLAEPPDFREICGDPTEAGLDLVEASMVDLINADRLEHAEEANQAAPVALDCAISDVARMHSYRMCITDTLAHKLDGATPQDRVESAYLWSLGDDYALLGENIAYHPDLVSAEDAFVEEEPPCDQVAGGHRLNILDRDFSHVGIGVCLCVNDPYENLYVTQNFITFDGDLVTGHNPYCLEMTGNAARFGPSP